MSADEEQQPPSPVELLHPFYLDTDMSMAFAAALAGGVALTAHSTKASARAAANVSPEPFSNWTLSFGEDLLSVWLTWLATAHPLAAIVIVCGLILLSAILLYYLFRFLRSALRKIGTM